MRLIKYAILLVTSFLPYPLPVGMKEFECWVEDIAQLSKLPYNQKLKNVIAQFILMLPPDTAFYSKRRLVKQIRKAASNQVAGEVLRLDKEKVQSKEPAKSLGQETSTVGIS